MSGQKDSPTVAASPSKADTAAIASKREYVQFLVTQEKYSQAEEVRANRKAMEARMQERDRRHKAQGLGRQQAATAQMKKASEAVDQHREQNLAKGRAVATEISQWEMGAKATKDQWLEYGKTIKQQVKEADATAASLAELAKKKKDAAATTRREDAENEKKLEDLKEQWKREGSEQVAKVKEQTGDKIIDDARRFFYDQRRAAAAETKEATQPKPSSSTRLSWTSSTLCLPKLKHVER